MYRVFVAGAGASLYTLDPRIQLKGINGGCAASVYPADVEIDFCLHGKCLHMILSRAPWCHLAVRHQGQDLEDGEYVLDDGTHVTISGLSMMLMVCGQSTSVHSWMN